MHQMPKQHLAKHRVRRLVIGLALLVLVGCTTTAGAAPTAVATLPPAAVATLPDTISVAEAAAKREAGAFFLDVREPAEWNQAHIPGSTLIPLGELEKRVNEVPHDKAVVVVCRSGTRSKAGRDILKTAGFTQVTCLNGGLNAWQAAGYPTVTGP